MRIALIAKPGHADSGIGRYTAQLQAALAAQGHEVVVVHPAAPASAVVARVARRLLGWDVAAFFNHYPIWARYPQADVYHVASQNLATLLMLRRPPGKVVVTVHDLIPWLTRDDPALRVYRHRLEAWFDRLALAGLRRADGLIADSEHTRASLRVAGLDAAVVALGVD